MLTAECSDQLLCFFHSLNDFYKKFLKLEQDKHTILLSGKLDQLDSCMKQEQAFVLEARGLEQKRQSLLKKAGAGEHSFHELISQTEPSRQSAMQKVYGDLSSALADVQQVNQKCNELARIKLGYVSHVLSKMENQPELKQIYGKDSHLSGNPERTFSRKV